ncbi:MAG: ABC transporter permease [Candidatus Limnocylindrales bacterium]
MDLDVAWIADHLDELGLRTLQHFGLAALAVAVGFGISLGLSIGATRARVTLVPLLTLAGILYTIPSLAMFAALVPITGLSLFTAEVPLVLYTLLIFMRNTVAGLDGVPADVLEAADGMGYPARARLLRVELPLAIPLIAAGVRLASVSTIGLVTISGILGDRYGGLGFFIFEGYRRTFPTEIFAGAIPSVVLAIAVDRLLVAAGRRLTPWARPSAGPER